MRIIEGSVDEIVEYQNRMALAADQEPEGGAAASEAIPDREPAPARSAGDSWDVNDEFFIRQFVYGRATDAGAAKRILDYLARVAQLGTVIEAGVSERSKDGMTDYLMVRDAGPRHFGAVVYVKPRVGGVTLRLRPEHVQDISDGIRLRDVAAKQRYAVNCALDNDEAVDLALDLTRRALDLIRTK